MNSLKTTNILLLVLAFLLAFHEAMGWWRPVGRYVTMSDREALLILDTTTGDVYVRKAGNDGKVSDYVLRPVRWAKKEAEAERKAKAEAEGKAREAAEAERKAKAEAEGKAREAAARQKPLIDCDLARALSVPGPCRNTEGGK